jgi:hypothetical protein
LHGIPVFGELAVGDPEDVKGDQRPGAEAVVDAVGSPEKDKSKINS